VVSVAKKRSRKPTTSQECSENARKNEFLSSPRVHSTPKQCRLILFWLEGQSSCIYYLPRSDANHAQVEIMQYGEHLVSYFPSYTQATLPSSFLFHLACLERTANMLVLRVSEHCHRVELPDTVYNMSRDRSW
jgi:hypothetical protein